jgi:ABC-2 type transport system ATP-binding protein
MATPEPVLRTTGLAKRYGKRLALAGLDLAVPPGRVFGFLGPNGAGKTTCISLILGLIAPSAGSVQLFGLDARARQAEVLPRVGAVLEGSAFYPDLSARDNLKVWAAHSPGIDNRRGAELLDLVGLGTRAGDKVRTFSLGMKQRLALAAALLHDPELLILDEPTNGLDPAGIREFRDLFRELGSRGKTVFVSSHLLGEVEQMCDEVAIINNGRLITQGAVADIVQRRDGLELRTTDDEAAAKLLSALEWVGDVRRENGRLIVPASRDRASDISRELAEHSIYLHELRPGEHSLEDFFLEVTSEEKAGG